MKLEPVPVAGLPPGADQEKATVPVPACAEAVQFTGLPAVCPLVGQVTVTVNVTVATETVWVAVAVTPLLSFAVTTTVKVPGEA